MDFARRSAPVPAEAAPAGRGPAAGATLAEVRKRRGLSVAEVAQRLRLGAGQIVALEADDYASLPGTTFVRGAIRSYSRLLELDPEPLLAAQERLAPAPATVIHVPSYDIRFPAGGASEAVPNWMKLAIGALALVVVIAGIWFVFPPATTATVVKKPAAAVGTVQTPVSAAASATPQAPVDTPPAGSAAPTPVAPAMAAAAAPPAANPSPGAGSPAAAATTPAAGQARLRLSFTAESWVEVKDGRGEVLLRALNPGGSEKQLDGQPPFAVVVGNVAGTTLTYNGAPVSLVSPKRDNVSRLTVPAQ